ncbi:MULTISPECIES: hypothetical protein [unclassified Bradyrhizobium]|uniref:hypothetical protein n=1 Tax=unclassified Bradyrhizobium TaxID=2631580 RepID=UPI0024791D60|nr:MULTISPECIES: hypothetical protein [unclassified Bradyrhizobium]WGR93191.1 hypothetical protein MTX20_36340 [Bradyrhizobium sp. ISRA435]WGR97708.1 hypothetical protein MTX23_25390 [Bradyrhizobium sp. ISRA436]WGS04598.1 hypothetical protein MTX18_25395 [Bradyrhizobium sp. ISRA437]WGS11479.1 hypothetical protein MTX26_25395 [Bradyrhizobium sp. ISRA443]WGS18923.1 hypothetical protein MTX22_31075 [Bradyrhizobium sp. ISRA463]
MCCIDRNALGCVFALCLVASASAQSGHPAPLGQTTLQGTLTGKERLGRKWTDEQRIDNCNVPPDKRGAKPRPTACRHAPSS